MAWYDDPEEVRRATAEALGVSLMGAAEDEEPDTQPTLSLNRIPDESQTLDVKPKEWWEEEGAVEAAMKEAGVSYASPMRIERSLSDEFGRGLTRGTDQTQGLGYGFVGLLGQAVGLKGVEEYGVENYLRKMEEAAMSQASVRDPFEEIDDLGDAGLYAAGIIGEQIPQLLASALGGGIGGLAAKTIGKRIVGNMIGKRVSAGLAGKTFADDAARVVATNKLRKEAAEEVAKETAGTLLANAGRAGGVSGAYLANFGQISGGSFGQMAQELGRGDAGIAAGFAVGGAALDTLGEVFIASKFLKPFSKAQRAAVDGVDTSLSLGRIGGGAATGFVAGSAIEGGTEYVQTGLEQAALGAADPNRTIGDVVMTPEAERERRIAGAAGATVGAPLGGVGGGFEVAFSPRTTQTLNDRARQKQTTQTTPETEQTSSRALTGDWSQPVRVDDVMMQRNSSGVWVALNPAEDLLEGIPRVQAEDGTPLLVVSPETGDQASFLIARAEKALSDLNEGDFSPEFQSQDESQADPEDDLGEATELSEETEATRLRQSPLGAEALRQQLGETEAVAAALAEPPASTEQPGQPIKPASKSAEVIDAALSEEEQVRQGEVGAMGVRIQAGRQEKVASKIMAPDVDTGEALQRVRNAGVVGDQADILLSNFYEKRKKELETAQEDRRKASEAALARPPVEAENFIKGLNTGDRVGLIGGQDRTVTMFVGGVKKTKKVIGARETTPMVFVGRRKNGNAVFETFATSPADGGQVGSRTRLELPPAQFARVTLAPPPQPTRTPLEQAFDDALGPNPTKQQAERVLGSPYTGTRGAQESMFSDGMGEPFPIEVSWFNKKGEKGTIIPSIKGKFTNSALTTVRQMNQGLEIVVPDDQLASVKKDIQVEAVSDKKGGRKNIVTGVNLWGRTYRRSLRSPKEFSVNEDFAYSGSEGQSQRDIAEKLRRGLLTQEQATKLLSNLDEFGRRSDLRKTRPSKSGLLIFNDIYKNSPERIARSQAAVRGAQERQTPPEQMLREWELVQAGLNPVEYTFYEDALGRATDFINRSNLSENVKDEARFEAQNKIVKAFGNRKKRRGKQPAEGSAALAKIYLEELEKLRGARLDDSRKRATRLIGNIERNPERMSDVEIARADDADPLRGPVEGSVAGQRAAAIEEKAIDEALKGNAVDLDRAVEATLKRLGKEQPKRTPKEVFNTRANLRSIATSYKNLGKFNPIYTAMDAVNTAVRSIRRREMNEQTELITDREARELASRQRATQDPATTQEFAESEIDLAQRADTMQTADRVVLPSDPEPEVNDTAAEINPDEPLLDQLSDARGRYYDLSEEDQILALRNRTLIKNERGKAVRGQKSSLTSAQKRRAKQIEQYLQNKQTYADLYPKSTAPSRRPNQPAAALPLGRFSSGEVLAGVAESPARGRAGQDPQGRPKSVGGPDRTGTGTVPGADNVRDGRSGVRASLAPQTVRGLSRAAKFRFVQSFGGLTDAEAAALTQAEIDLAYEAVTTRKRAGAVLGGRTVVGTTPKSLADLATMSGSELLAGATEARRAYEADREAVQVVRDNVGELLRTRAFADINTFLGAIGTSRLPRDLKLRAREFAKLTERGVDLNGVGVQIGRFGGDTSWAGIMTRETGDGYAIAINLDSLQDRDSAVNTILHELSHVVSAKKIAGEVRLNKVERDALNRLEALRREAVIAAARDLGFDVPRNFTDADIQRLSQDLANRSNDPSGDNRVYNSLKDLTEFTTEISSNPELAGLMARLGFGQAKGKVTLLNAVRDAWNALVELIAGIKADPNSPLAKAFKDSWILNYSNAGGDMNLGDYTMPEIRRSTISRELQQRREVEETIDREIEARNLEGTTAQRKAIAKELAKPKSGKRRNNRAAAQQATGDTVQVAESRAVRTRDGVPINYVNKDTLGRAFGFTDGERIFVREDLPEAISNFVAEHEAQHIRDAKRGDNWILSELRANFFPGIKDPIGLVQTVLGSLSMERLGFYFDRFKSNDAVSDAVSELLPTQDIRESRADTVQVAESRAVRREQQSLEAERNALIRDIVELEPDVEIADPRFTEIARANTTATLKQIRTSLGLQRPAPPTSSAFKGWFKNSKITNRLFGGDNDQPARMFHGSPFNIESVFRSEEEIQREAGLSRWGDEVGDEFGNSGIYFTATPRYASIYARDNIGGNVTPVYLSIQNPYYVRDQDGWWGATTNYFKALKRWSRSESESFGESLGEVRAESRSTNIQTRSSAYISNRRLQELKEQGYDGIINLDADEVVVFQPTQIKSAITNTGEFSSTNPDIRESRARGRVTPKQDTGYLAAVESGDMETVQRMVDEAAKAAGYSSGPWFHATSSEFNVFARSRSGNYGPGIYLTDNLKDARAYASASAKNSGDTPRVIRVYANFEDGRTGFLINPRRDIGRDGVRWLKVGDSNQLKSADPVTRDDQGNVIPLSERFNEASPDIRESRARGRVTPPVPSKAEWEAEIGEELLQANTILQGKAPLKLIKVRDDLDYDTSYISGTHIFKTPEGDIITASKEDGQWDMQSIFNGEVSTFEEDAITYALERLSEELAEKRMMLAGDVYDEFLDMPKDHPFWSSDLATMDLEDAPKVYRMIDYYNSLPKQSTNPDIRESRARGRVWRERVRVTPTGGTISQGGMFAVDELLDKRAGDAYRSSRMAIKADISVIQELSRLLERQMKSLYKGQTAPLETINTALGNLENPLNSQQLEEIERLFNAKKTKQASDKRDQFIRENRKRFREVTQPAALAQLPEELASTIREMSSHIASLSKRLPNEGLVSGDLAITVEEALGMYLNRSYAIFDDPKWVDRVRKNPKVMDAARKFIRNMLTDDKANNLIDDAAASGRVLSIADAKSMANDSVTDADIEATLEGYLAVGEEAPSVEVLSGRIPGQKNLSMLTPRGNIAPEIQALWGRYEDPTVNYAKTVMKLSSVIANNQFLTELRDLGVEEGWLWSSKNNPDDLRHPPGYIKISSESNPALSPLGGMYAHPMLAEGLFKMFPVGSTDQHYWWLQSAMKLTGISMAVKTVGSVASQIRNYLGNYLNLIATGNLGLGDIAPGSDFWKRFKNSNDTVLANTFNKYRNATRAEWRAKIDDYIRRGIVGESVTTGLLEDLLTASRKAGSPDFGDVVWNKVSEPLKRVADFATKTYSSGDDWFKVMIYEAEQDKYRKAYPEWDDNKVKEKAATIARDIHWTYSLAPSIVQDLKKFPFVAPFVTFTTEVIRTTYNLQKLARQEIMEGRASGNKELEAIGWKRVRGMTTAAFLPAAAGSATMALAGISGDDEEDLRRFLPDWQKNNQLMLFRKENGEVSFVDISFLDPYEYFKKPLTAFMRSLREGDNASEMLLGGTMAMVRQAVDPFTSEQIFAGAIMDVMRNQDAAGRQVYNPQDTGANIGTAVARKIFIEPFTPGTFTSLDRIGKAAFGVQSESGRAYGLFNELASVMAGQRVSEMDAQQALQFKGSRFMREMRDASALFNREFVSQGTRSAGDVVSGYERSNGARRALIGSIRKDYLAAIRLGVPVARAKAILRDAGVGRETLRMATTGIYKPFEASEDSLSLVRARGNSDRITAYNQARRATPTKEVLP